MPRVQAAESATGQDSQFQTVLALAREKSAQDKLKLDSVDTAQRYRNLDIPENLLEGLDNLQLIDILKEYPLMVSCRAFDTPEEGLSHLARVYSPFRVLESRPEGRVLLERMCRSTDRSAFNRANGEVDPFRFLVMQVNERSRHSDRAASITVRTPKGSAVVGLKRGEELSAERKAVINKGMAQAFPSAKRIGEPTTRYNCHSYALYSASTDNEVWINDPSPYYQDGSYVRAKGRDSADVVYYQKSDGTPSHSGLRIGQGMVRSKWGEAGLYEHGRLNCPYATDGQKISFWTKS